MNQKEFIKETTLNQALKELEESGMSEITRIMSRDGIFTFEYK
ncbi:hypothetical protein LCGC14_1818800 [marine sediment metagenome]|uniref:Uncharacterized protein n=1 Tax=marine sediment metagenome TaxID=412755 RepID=A0A0F9GJL5_9ZZZZ